MVYSHVPSFYDVVVERLDEAFGLKPFCYSQLDGAVTVVVFNRYFVAMTISEERVKRLVEQFSQPLTVIAADVRVRLVWDFNLPVAVIDARHEPPVLMQSSVGSLGNVLRVSTKIDHPLIRQLFDIYPDRGSDAAIDEMLNGQHGKEFADVFADYQEEKQAGTLMWGADDLASFVVKSRTCFEDDELAIAAIFPADIGDNGHALATFGIPWRYFAPL